ncbi:MAG TPA: alpha-L-fucosidase [Candidatus Ratteibacteria bacterium]|jgi:alpha-L-fucosidase|uniref:alpha-L-fucosidase n=1 Tax=candidate division TA06 bacterium ADurb.Bin131 TaxID=1852827 RepID=A0A1V6C6T3_UNCT6|nr:MAG: Alpha-L-fucosidase [candidate division TA06 bacterium ADurb.Bin131]HOC03108.1 alpha-L-fucosidase [bacterium]HRS05581.1 alpha-L-fucosidase [Candidatus Ratteibacteria bacterium]HON05729.1 alpha-L-fucosidase [bacterium]HPC29439.1 alpha-L-fucosidase [bacterium]
MNNNVDKAWFVNDRFGMFIHWGLYSLPARHEWVKNREEIPDEKYDIYFRHFDPDLFDPELWAKTAKQAGMRYAVITTKHHEGFCLWDSQYTDYKATNTPAKRDLIREFVDAFRAQGLKIGFYYSLLDWHHPDFTIDSYHPLRNHPEREKLNKTRDMKKYTEYLHNQIRELLTNYGRIDIIWCDFSYPTEYPGRPDGFIGKGRQDWQSEKLIKLIRSLQPHILINNRLDMPDDWDFLTPEQIDVPNDITVDGKSVVWEACHTFSGSWGYHRDESSWKSSCMIIRMLIDIVSKNGNLLLNVGPTARGEFDFRVMERMKDIGDWMKKHSRSIYGCKKAPDGFESPENCRITFNPETNRLYIHIFAWPFRFLRFQGFEDRVEYAQLLNDGSEIPVIKINNPSRLKMTGTGIKEDETKKINCFILPVQKPDVSVPVIEVFLKK